MKHPRLIIVHGPPASGKSSLGETLAQELNIPLVSKDVIKVKLFDTYGWKDRAASKQAGQAAYEILDYIIEEQLRVGHSIMVEGTFHAEFANPKFHRWQEQYNVKFIQIGCTADADILRKRFKERATTNNRHVSHIEGVDGLKNLEILIERGVVPFSIPGEIITIDTTDFSKVDTTTITHRIHDLLRTAD